MEKKSAGRPPALTKGRWKRLLEYMCEGMSVPEACRQDDMPSRATVMKGIAADKEKQKQYREASEIRAYLLMEETLDIADDGTNDWEERQTKDGEKYEVFNHEHVARSKLRNETRFQHIDRLSLKKWGEEEGESKTGTLQKFSDEQILAAMLEVVVSAKAEQENGS